MVLCYVMNILTTIRHIKGIIALIVAASILEVTVCDVLCGEECSPVSKHELTLNEDHQQSNESGHHKQDLNTEQSPASHFHQPSSSSEKDDCCEDITNQFYKSLFSGSDSGSVKAPLHTFILLTVLSNYHLVSSGSHLNSSGNIFTIPPNLPGKYLRILINSFLI